jgi:hypothetical protein
LRRRQKSEGRRQKAEVRRHESEDTSQEIGVRSQETDGGVRMLDVTRGKVHGGCGEWDGECFDPTQFVCLHLSSCEFVDRFFEMAEVGRQMGFGMGWK